MNLNATDILNHGLHGWHGWHGWRKGDEAGRHVVARPLGISAVTQRSFFIRAIRVIRGSTLLVSNERRPHISP